MVALLPCLIAIIIVSTYPFAGLFSEQRQNVDPREHHPPAATDEAPAANLAAQNTGHNAQSTFSALATSKGAHSDSIQTLSKAGSDILIFGRVVDNNNRPLADVVVATAKGFQNTVTDTNGRYGLQIPVPRENYQGLTFLRSGYTAERISIVKRQMKGTDEIEHNATLSPALDTVSVSGVLRNKGGRAIEGERIELFSRKMNLYYFALTGAYGEFYFEGVKIGQRYSLQVDPRASYQQYRKENINVSHSTPPLEIEMQAIPFARLSGTIIDSEGVPVPNFPMQILSSTVVDKEYSLLSDASGYFELEEIPSGRLKLVHRGNPHFKVSGIELAPSATQHVLIRLDSGRHIVEGWVNDNYGVPLVNARVTLTGSHTDSSIESKSNRWLSSDSNGFFRFERVGDGMHNITIQARGYEGNNAKYSVGRSGTPIHIVLLPDTSTE